MPLASTYRRRLREEAAQQHGFITTAAAARLGVPPGELRKLAHRGGLEHAGWGVWRFDDWPVDRLTGFMEATLLVGPGAHLHATAVLALHELGEVVPRRVRVATPRRCRRTLPAWIDVARRRLPPGALTTFEGIPATTVAQALADCTGGVPGWRLEAAADEARRRGLITRQAAARLPR